jgi:hypothetical protein
MGGCETNAGRTPAVLPSQNAAAMDEIKTVAARAMNKASVTLGPGDPTQSPTIAVLPPALSAHETRSTAMPTLFDLMIIDGACMLVRREDGAGFALPGVSCVPAQKPR